MTWRAFLDGIIRSRVINGSMLRLLTDIDTNGLNAADDAIIDSYLDQTKP